MYSDELLCFFSTFINVLLNLTKFFLDKGNIIIKLFNKLSLKSKSKIKNQK